MSDCCLPPEPPHDLAKAVATATAKKRPRRSSSRLGSASSGSKSGGAAAANAGGTGVAGTANAATRNRLVERKNPPPSRRDEDDATTTPPALFFYSNLHDAVRAELSALLASVSVASSAPTWTSDAMDVADDDVSVGVGDGGGGKSRTHAPTTTTVPAATARSRALADVAARARLLEKVHAYHSAVEDEVLFLEREEKTEAFEARTIEQEEKKKAPTVTNLDATLTLSRYLFPRSLNST